MPVMEWVLIIVALAHLFYAPFTKVEESFNIQAVHDILYLRFNLSSYDHLEFPGVVPRTFIGPLFLAFASSPAVFLIDVLNVGKKFLAQYVVRAALCLSVTTSLIVFSRSLRSQLGSSFAWWFLAISTSQYHVLYYSSRPLPNMLALPLVLLAASAALRPTDSKYFLLCSGAAIIWFRTELAILLGVLLLIQLYDRRITIVEVAKIATPAGIGLIAATLAIDSLFWQRPVWPEAEVFYFNAVLNKSSQWGTSPFLWYFYSALPRGLASSVLFVPLGLFYESRIRRLVLAGFLFVLAFSFLPHKELRFIIYTYPFFNAAAAAACQRLWNNRHKSSLRLLLGVGAAGHLALNAAFTIFLLMVARVNYPGGVAITRLHEIVPNDFPAYVHIENLAAQTGVTRFTETNTIWRYSKLENLTRGSHESLQFTHLIVEAKSKYSANLKPYGKTHSTLTSIDGFSEVSVNYHFFPPVRIKTKPLLFILERNPNVYIPDIEPIKIADADIDEVEEISEEQLEKADASDSFGQETLNDNDAEFDEDERRSRELDREEISDELKDISDKSASSEKTESPEPESDDFAYDEEIERLEFANDEKIEKDDFAYDEEIVDDENENEADDAIEFDEPLEDGDLLAMASEEVAGKAEKDPSLNDLIKQLEDKMDDEAKSDRSRLEDAILDPEILDDLKKLGNLKSDESDLDLQDIKKVLKEILGDYKKLVFNDTSSQQNGRNGYVAPVLDETIIDENETLVKEVKKSKKLKKKKASKDKVQDEEVKPVKSWYDLFR